MQNMDSGMFDLVPTFVRQPSYSLGSSLRPTVFIQWFYTWIMLQYRRKPALSRSHCRTAKVLPPPHSHVSSECKHHKLYVLICVPLAVWASAVCLSGAVYKDLISALLVFWMLMLATLPPDYTQVSQQRSCCVLSKPWEQHKAPVDT